MKTLLLALLALVGYAQAQITYDGGRTQNSDSLRWGDSDDSTGYLRARGNAVARDSAGSWVTITTDSCSKALALGVGTVLPNKKLELSYEVRTSSGNTDSSQVKLRFDTRYCRGVSGTNCESWVPAGRFKPDTTTQIIDSLITVATTSGTTWTPTRQIFDVPGGNQIRACVDGYKAGGAAADTTFFRKFVVRTSGLPSGGAPPSSTSVSGTGLATSAIQTDGSQKTQIVDGSGNVIGSTINALDVNIKSGAGSGGTAIADDAAFTVATTSITPAGGIYKSTLDAVDDGDAGAFAMTSKRAMHSYLVDANGDPVSVGGGTQYAEDVASADGHIGTAALAVRKATPANTSGTDGDYEMLQMSAGRLWVDASGKTLTVDGSGVTQPVSAASLPLPSGAATSANQSTEITALQLLDDPVIADDAAFTPATSKVNMAGFEFDDTSPDVVDEGDAGAARMSSRREVYTQIRDAAGNERGAAVTASNALKVDGSAVTQPVSGTVAATQSGTWAVTGSAATDAAVSGNPVYTAGRASAAAPSDVSADGDVVPPWMLRSGAAVTQPSYAGVLASTGNGTAGTGTPRVTIASDNTAFSVNATATGAAAHDAAVSGNPVLGAAEARTSNGTAVANGDVTRLQATIEGKIVTKPHSVLGATWTYAAASGGITNTTAATMKAAAGAGVRVCLTSIQVINGHATVSTEVSVKDGAGGTVLHRGFAQAAGGGYAANFDVPICGTANTLMEVVPVTTGSAIYVNAQGYTTAE